jgi:hypothetical protein
MVTSDLIHLFLCAWRTGDRRPCMQRRLSSEVQCRTTVTAAATLYCDGASSMHALRMIYCLHSEQCATYCCQSLLVPTLARTQLEIDAWKGWTAGRARAIPGGPDHRSDGWDKRCFFAPLLRFSAFSFLFYCSGNAME